MSMLTVAENDYVKKTRIKSAGKILNHTGNNNCIRENIFRLAAVLCLFLLINPSQYVPQAVIAEESAPEYGIGGGYLYEEAISEEETEIMINMSQESDSSIFDKTQYLFYNSYLVKSGDNISTLAIVYGLNQGTIISVNKITNSRLLQIGQVLKLPNQDGILHKVIKGESLDSIADRYKIDKEDIKIKNELFSENIVTGTDLFIPGAQLDWNTINEINGDLFIWPVRDAITSYYGTRRNPFNRSYSQFHNGIDIRGSTGTPVGAAMAGRVSAVGWDNVYGNYIIINHHSGYRTLYGHLSVIRVRNGANVAQGQRIGDIGSTGQSTGPHLHFTVFKNGATINPLIVIR